MSRKDFAAWGFVDFSLNLLSFCQFKNRQAMLTFAFLCAAFLAQLECGAAGEALALRAFSNGLNIGQAATFRTKFRQGGTSENQGKGE